MRWGLYEGLSISWEVPICVVMDSAAVLNLLREDLSCVRNTLVQHIADLIWRDWDIRFIKVTREDNRVTDILTKMSRGVSVGRQIFYQPPLEIMGELEEDVRLSSKW
ncbi:hypothetical protein V6N13_027683 [Hibiscus sabdariffa]